MRSRATAILLPAALLLATGLPTGCRRSGDTDVQARIDAAIPTGILSRRQPPRRLLVYTHCEGERHASIMVGRELLDAIGRKTKAYEAVFTDSASLFDPEVLNRFDAVCLLNNEGELPLSPAQRAAFLEFVKSGKGFVAIHGGLNVWFDWAEYHEMLGGSLGGMPWDGKVTLKMTDPKHPLNNPFGGKPFEVADEIYHFPEPDMSQKLHILLSVDTERTARPNPTTPPNPRKDGLYPVSWIRRYGKGRVFYCTLGHRPEIYWNPTIVQHYMYGIRFALGDFECDTTPTAGPAGAVAQTAPTSRPE